MTGDNLPEQLCKAVAALGITADNTCHNRVREWLALLMKWNRRYNLTAIRDAEAIIQNLILDSLSAARHLRGHNILDVGSGAGVPGMPLAIYCPDKHFTLVDSNGKKTRFMEHCRLQLGLENISVIKARVEEMQSPQPFDTIISRALGALEIFVSASHHLAHADTLWLTYKGHEAAKEPPESPRDNQNGINWRIETLGFLNPAQTRKLVGITLQK